MMDKEAQEKIVEIASMVWAFGLNQRMMLEGKAVRFSPGDFKEQRLINKNPHLDFAQQLIKKIDTKPLDRPELKKLLAPILCKICKEGERYCDLGGCVDLDKDIKQILALIPEPTLNLPDRTPEKILNIWGFSKGFKHDGMPDYLAVVQAYKELIISKNGHLEVETR